LEQPRRFPGLLQSTVGHGAQLGGIELQPGFAAEGTQLVGRASPAIQLVTVNLRAVRDFRTGARPFSSARCPCCLRCLASGRRARCRMDPLAVGKARRSSTASTGLLGAGAPGVGAFVILVLLWSGPSDCSGWRLARTGFGWPELPSPSV